MLLTYEIFPSHELAVLGFTLLREGCTLMAGRGRNRQMGLGWGWFFAMTWHFATVGFVLGGRDRRTGGGGAEVLGNPGMPELIDPKRRRVCLRRAQGGATGGVDVGLCVLGWFCAISLLYCCAPRASGHVLTASVLGGGLPRGCLLFFWGGEGYEHPRTAGSRIGLCAVIVEGNNANTAVQYIT